MVPRVENIAYIEKIAKDTKKMTIVGKKYRNAQIWKKKSHAERGSLAVNKKLQKFRFSGYFITFIGLICLGLKHINISA